jgi:Fur family transcriptional regulator, ferric uptake regulator
MSARGAAWAERARRELAARGHRSGEARRAVIDALAEHDGCCTAAELAGRMRSDGSSVGTASVYRALGALQEAELVRALDLGEGERRYELVHADGEHHHHVVCDVCGATTPFHDEALERSIAELARKLDWQVDAHDVVLHGRCARCAKRS